MVKRQSTRAKAGLASREEMIQFKVKSLARKNQALKKLGDQEVREMERKEDGEEVGFPGL